MVLIKEEIKNNYQIILEFDSSNEDFQEFEQIFNSLKELDKFCETFLTSYKFEDKSKIEVRSSVNRLSKNSPFELTAFITDHWFEIFLFTWGSYDRIRPNAQLIYRDIADLINTLETSLKDVIEDLPNLDYKKLDDVLKWFNNLPFIERAKIANKMLRHSKVFRKIRKIIFNKK